MENFSFNLKWHRILKRFSDNIRHNVMDALMEYIESGKAPELKTAEAIAFEFIKTEIEENAQTASPAPQPESPAAPEPSKETENPTDTLPDLDETIANVPALVEYFSNRERNHCAEYTERTFRLDHELHKEIAVKAACILARKEGIPLEQCRNLIQLDSELLNICYPVFDGLRPGINYGEGAIITREEYARFMESQQGSNSNAKGTQPADSSKKEAPCVSAAPAKCDDDDKRYSRQEQDNIIRTVPALKKYFSGEDPRCCAAKYSDLLKLDPELHKELAIKVMFERTKKEHAPIRKYVNHKILAEDLFNLCSPVAEVLRPDHGYGHSKPITRAEWMVYMRDKKKRMQCKEET